LVSVPAEIALFAMAARNACWRFIRPMSPFSDSSWRSRT
jgi:hypothetical protein